jgi:hypothetical protein
MQRVRRKQAGGRGLRIQAPNAYLVAHEVFAEVHKQPHRQQTIRLVVTRQDRQTHLAQTQQSAARHSMAQHSMTAIRNQYQPSGAVTRTNCNVWCTVRYHTSTTCMSGGAAGLQLALQCPILPCTVCVVHCTVLYLHELCEVGL